MRWGGPRGGEVLQQEQCALVEVGEGFRGRGLGEGEQRRILRVDEERAPRGHGEQVERPRLEERRKRGLDMEVVRGEPLREGVLWSDK